MKIRITEPGSEHFTGDFGPVPFEDGVSTRDVSQVEASRLAGLIRVETIEDTPRNPSMSQQVLDSQVLSMNEEMLSTSRQIIVDPAKRYTLGELEAIADKDGIEGLRNIGDPLNVRSASIVKLIAAILKAQAPAVATIIPTELTQVASAAADASAANTAGVSA